MFQGHLRQDTAQPHQVPRWHQRQWNERGKQERMGFNDESSKANNKRHVQSMSMTEKAAQCTTIPGSLSVYNLHLWKNNLSNEERVQLKSINAIPRIGAWPPKHAKSTGFFLLVQLYLLGSEIFKISTKFGTRKSLNTNKTPPRSWDVTEILEGCSFFAHSLPQKILTKICGRWKKLPGWRGGLKCNLLHDWTSQAVA